MSHTNKGGRPTILTDELIAEIAQYLRHGNYAVTAAEAAGIDESTYYRWKREAVALLDSGRPQTCFNEREARLVRFYQSVTRAGAQAEVESVALLRRAATDRTVEDGVTPGDWRAAAEWLRRARPSRWNRSVVEGGAASSPVRVELVMPDNGRRRDPDED